MRSTQQLSAYDNLKNKLITLELEPGQKIKESELQKALDVGRTPLREALIQLKVEGLITVLPQSGTYVSKINPSLIENGSFVRRVVERQVIQSVIEKPSLEFINQLDLNLAQTKILETLPNPTALFEFDMAFHELFYQVANKEQVWQWLQVTSTDLNRINYLVLSTMKNSTAFIIKQHQAIINSIKARYTEQTLQLGEEHFKHIVQSYPDLIKAYPDYFSEDKVNK